MNICSNIERSHTTMFCPNCGAKLKDSDVTCPYCGTVQPSAAESEYMHKLEHLKQDVQNLASLSVLLLRPFPNWPFTMDVAESPVTLPM